MSVVKNKIYRFYSFYNNFNIGKNINLNNVKVFLHEVKASSQQDAFEQYKLHIIHKCKVCPKDVNDYLCNLYGNKIYIEIVNPKHVSFSQIVI